MLGSFTRKFDYVAVEKKLYRYFLDSSPVRADVVMNMTNVCVSSNGKTVCVALSQDISPQHNVTNVVRTCEQQLYPRMYDETKEELLISSDMMVSLLSRGYSLSDIANKKVKNTVRKQYIITRISILKNTLHFIGKGGDTYKATLFMPAPIVREKVLYLADKGISGQLELYKYITSNALVERLDAKV